MYMAQPQRIEIEEVIEPIRLRSTQRDCPRCDAVLILNNHEQCYECDSCGYIDCGDEYEE